MPEISSSVTNISLSISSGELSISTSGFPLLSLSEVLEISALFNKTVPSKSELTFKFISTEIDPPAEIGPEIILVALFKPAAVQDKSFRVIPDGI